MIRAWIDEAVTQGARRNAACQVLGLSRRTLVRWRGAHPCDVRNGPHQAPANQLTRTERRVLLETVNSPAYRDRSPAQIVPHLADAGRYVGSEATIYRMLRAQHQLAHRGRAHAPVRRAVRAHEATGVNQVWSWDITYLKSPIAGVFFYLYLIIDIWSRKIVGGGGGDDCNAIDWYMSYDGGITWYFAYRTGGGAGCPI